MSAQCFTGGSVDHTWESTYLLRRQSTTAAGGGSSGGCGDGGGGKHIVPKQKKIKTCLSLCTEVQCIFLSELGDKTCCCLH
jgi:hypothetical protein